MFTIRKLRLGGILPTALFMFSLLIPSTMASPIEVIFNSFPNNLERWHAEGIEYESFDNQFDGKRLWSLDPEIAPSIVLNDGDYVGVRDMDTFTITLSSSAPDGYGLVYYGVTKGTPDIITGSEVIRIHNDSNNPNPKMRTYNVCLGLRDAWKEATFVKSLRIRLSDNEVYQPNITDGIHVMEFGFKKTGCTESTSYDYQSLGGSHDETQEPINEDVGSEAPVNTHPDTSNTTPDFLVEDVVPNVTSGSGSVHTYINQYGFLAAKAVPSEGYLFKSWGYPIKTHASWHNPVTISSSTIEEPTHQQSSIQLNIAFESDPNYIFVIDPNDPILQDPPANETTTPDTTIPNNPTPATGNPLVIIPGILESELYVMEGDKKHYRIWPDAACIELTPDLLHTSDLGNTIHRTVNDRDLALDSGVVLGVGDVLQNYTLQSDWNCGGEIFSALVGYDKMIDSFVDSDAYAGGKSLPYPFSEEKVTELGLYTPGDNLFVMPYDWRQSNAVSSQNLAQVIDWVKQATQSDTVDILTHSMGGLIARHYVNVRGGAENINKVVFLTVPNHGSAEAYQTLKIGSWMGFDLKIPFTLVSQEISRDISRTFPSMYELLPTPKFMELYGFLANDIYGLGSELRGGPTEDPDIAVKETYMFNPYSKIPSQYQSYIENAIKFHEAMGDDFEFTGDFYLFAGQGMHTINQFDVTNFCNTPLDVDHVTKRLVFKYDHEFQGKEICPRFEDGDGTVPLKSAIVLKSYGPQAVFHRTETDHSEVYNKQDIIDAVLVALHPDTSLEVARSIIQDISPERLKIGVPFGYESPTSYSYRYIPSDETIQIPIDTEPEYPNETTTPSKLSEPTEPIYCTNDYEWFEGLCKKDGMTYEEYIVSPDVSLGDRLITKSNYTMYQTKVNMGLIDPPIATAEPEPATIPEVTEEPVVEPMPEEDIIEQLPEEPVVEEEPEVVEEPAEPTQLTELQCQMFEAHPSCSIYQAGELEEETAELPTCTNDYEWFEGLCTKDGYLYIDYIVSPDVSWTNKFMAKNNYSTYQTYVRLNMITPPTEVAVN